MGYSRRYRDGGHKDEAHGAEGTGEDQSGLDVLGKRENGYHDVRMIMQSIYLYDEVRLDRSEEPGIRVKTNLGFLPTGEGEYCI